MRKLKCTSCEGYGFVRRLVCQDCAGKGEFVVATPKKIVTLTPAECARMLSPLRGKLS